MEHEIVRDFSVLRDSRHDGVSKPFADIRRRVPG